MFESYARSLESIGICPAGHKRLYIIAVSIVVVAFGDFVEILDVADFVDPDFAAHEAGEEEVVLEAELLPRLGGSRHP